MTNPVGYDKDGNPLFKVKDRDDTRQAERAERIEEEAKKRRWDLGRMFRAATELVNRMRMK